MFKETYMNEVVTELVELGHNNPQAYNLVIKYQNYVVYCRDMGSYAYYPAFQIVCREQNSKSDVDRFEANHV